MTRLETEYNLGPHGDDIYAALLAAHDGLSDAESARLNVRLVLVLANQVGDPEVLLAAFVRARQGVRHQGQGNGDPGNGDPGNGDPGGNDHGRGDG